MQDPFVIFDEFDAGNKRIDFLQLLGLPLRVCLHYGRIEFAPCLHQVNLLLIHLVHELAVVPLARDPIRELIEAVEYVHAVVELVMFGVEPVHHLLSLVLADLDEQLRRVLLVALDLRDRLETLVDLHERLLEQPLAEDAVEFVEVHCLKAIARVQLTLHNLHRLLSKQN